MNNSPTEGVEQLPASNEPTGNTEVQLQSAEQSNQDANSREQSQESVSDDTANQEQKQTQQTGGESNTDDGLAKFAKSQGFELETASDDIKRLLKVAHDNQKAARSSKPSKSIVDATESLGDGSLQAEVAQLKYDRKVDKFWSNQNHDKSLEPVMIEILNEKQANMEAELVSSMGLEKAQEAAKNYAFQLSRDLDTLYGFAQLKNGANNNGNVDVEAIRREERESINRQIAGGAPQAHATQSGPATTIKVTAEWIRNEYNSKNPEHRALVDAFYKQ